MLLRLLPVALLACSLLVVAPADAGTCVGVSSGDDCTGVYESCDQVTFICLLGGPYVCVGAYEDGTCTGVQKP